jgi:hypothetical protein
MKLMTEEITEEFIERMTDRVIASLSDKLEQLDISLDFIGAVLADADSVALAGRQKKIGRMHAHGGKTPDMEDKGAA